MSEAVFATKDLAKVPGGKARAAQRWSDPANRTAVKLDDLSVEQRRLVLALVNAARSANDTKAA